MTLTDWIVIGTIVLVVGGAAAYIIKAKKSGKKCIGCPYGGSCGTNNQSEGCGGTCDCCRQGCNQTATKSTEQK